MAIGNDFSIASNGDIRYIGVSHGASGAGYYTVIELHRWLQDKADDASASGDDILDITSTTPSGRDTDNIINLLGAYNIDQTASEHLYDGTILQNSGADVWDGIVNYGNEGINIQLIQNGAIVSNDFWNSLPDGETLTGLNRDLVQGISHRFLIKTITAGVPIDNKRILGISREFGKTYTEFNINATASGNNVLALVNAEDPNNQTDSATVGGWTTITNVEGYQGIDINNDGTDEYYFSQWNRDTYTINQLYERAKYLTRVGTAETLYGLSGDIFRGITHEIAISSPSGTFQEPEQVSWSGGTGQLFAIDSVIAGTVMYIQLLTGSTPNSETITGATSGATATSGTVIDRTSLITQPFLGTSTGTAITGAYGEGVERLDLTASDKVTDLSNSTFSPPDYRVTTVGGIVSGEDRVLVAPSNGGTLEDGQFVLSVGTTSGNSSLTVGSGVETLGTGTQSATDTPSSGTIRVLDDTGVYQRVTYTGFSVGASDMTFTGLSGCPTATSGNNVYISYIDDIASGSNITFTTIYNGARTLFARVRDGGTSPIKTFENTVALGASISAIRTPDA